MNFELKLFPWITGDELIHSTESLKRQSYEVLNSAYSYTQGHNCHEMKFQPR